MAYVDGFVVPVPNKNVAAYVRIAQRAGEIWLEHGALEYRECAGDDLDVKMGTSFRRQVGLKRGETVFFSWIVYRSRAHRDEVNAKVMKDPRMDDMGSKMPFDVKRMVYGGFETRVDLAPAGAPERGRRAAARPNRKRSGRSTAAGAQPTAR